MRYLVLFLCCFSLAPHTLAQAPIRDEEIAYKIKSFAEGDTPSQEQWEMLLQLRNSRNALLKEINTLNKSNAILANQEANLLKPVDLKEVSKDINSPTPDQITQRVNSIKQLSQNTETLQETLRSSLAAAEAREQQIPEEIIKAQADLAALQAMPEFGDEISNFIKLEDHARLERLLKKLQLEEFNLNSNLPILKINLQTVASDNAKITELYNLWNDKLTDANKDTAVSIKNKAVQEAEKLSDGSLAKEIANQIILSSESLLITNSIHSELKKTRQELANLKQTLRQIDEQQKHARERIKLLENAGLSLDPETGKLLRKQRSELPSEKDLRLRLAAVFQNSTNNGLALLKEREGLAFIDSLSPDTYQDSLTEIQKSEITKEEFTSLISSAKQIHNMVISERADLGREYRDLVILLQRNIQSSKSYSLFIDTRLLWIVSHPRIGKQSFIDELTSLKTLYSPASFSQLFSLWQLDIYQSPVIWILFSVTIIIIIAPRMKIHSLAKEAHLAASSNDCNTFKPTLLGLFYIIILTLPIPLILSFLAWRTPTELPLQAGLLMGGIAYLILRLISRMCKIDGFLEANQMLKTGHVRLIRRVAQALFIILPIIVITATSLTKINAELTQGRIFNMLSLITVAVAMHHILLPKKRLLSGKKKPGILSYLAYLIFVIFPLILVAVAACGYFISMLTLKDQLILTIRIILLILITAALLKRWLFVTRRRALMNCTECSFNDPDSPLTDQEKRQEIQDNISKVSEQSNKLIRVAATVVLVFSLLTIWSKTLPALAVLDDVQLWETSESENSTPSSNLNPMNTLTGTSEPLADPSQASTSSISLQDLLITIIVSFLTYLAAVNIPSLLQITILNHLKLQHGSAFTITTSIRYIIIIVGIIWAFGSIGVTWNKIQWLAAAITLGIGFGLQEIFANFVAGIILLFERPIRIGDLITIGDISGKVSKIQMRATTILQFNNRELIVPNKEFITGQLENWTLSDSIIRTEIPIGIAYGSDTELAKSILLQCAKNNRLALEDPKPKVIFNAFGASSLDFLLRTHVSSPDDLINIHSELHFAIDHAFREAGIEIAFPQQDIHIRSIDASFPAEKSTAVTD